MLGVLFTMPQYFQGVLGTDAMGSGLRLLPLIGGLVVGAALAHQVARLAGAKVTLAARLRTAHRRPVPRRHDGRGLGRPVRGSLDGPCRGRHGRRYHHRVRRRARRADRGTQRRRLRGAAGSHQDRGPIRDRDPRQRAQRGLPCPAQPAGASGSAAAAVRQSIFGGVAVARQIRSASLLRPCRQPLCTAWTWLSWCPPPSP